MNDRPTPEQIADEADADPNGRLNLSGGHQVLDKLAEHGYVIVHPDDVPIVRRGYEPWRITNWLDGWNDCRAHIFSERSET